MLIRDTGTSGGGSKGNTLVPDFNTWSNNALNPSSNNLNDSGYTIINTTVPYQYTGAIPVSETANLQNFKTTIENLKNRLSYSSTYNVWVSFIAGSLNICTGNKEQNLIASLDYTRHGSGKANTFNLTLYYNADSNMSKSTYGNPNWIDLQLFKHVNKKCTLQYGYDTGDGVLISPKYSGIILDWSVELRGQILIYNIKGFTTIAKYSEETRTYPTVTNRTRTSVVYDVFTNYINEKKKVDLTMSNWKVRYVAGTEGTDEICEEIKASNTPQNIFDYASAVLSEAVDKNQKFTGEEYEKYVTKIRYEYYIDDVNETVFITRVDPMVKTAEIIVPFYWFSKSNSILMDFKPDISGAVFMALNAKNSSGEAKYNYSFDEDGNIVAKATNNELVVSSNSVENDLNAGIDNWGRATQYAYKATATMMGIPCLIPMLTKIKIVPIINEVEHHTSGIYMITEINDQIDVNGYKTILKLVKCTPEYLIKNATTATTTTNSNTTPSGPTVVAEGFVVYTPKEPTNTTQNEILNNFNKPGTIITFYDTTIPGINGYNLTQQEVYDILGKDN